ncbi:hypothetical protein CBI75_06045 [Salmonella enterica]|nr:hypothetical protein CBI75_06045 [Salmonella enterica]
MLKMIFFCTERKTDKIADITAVSAFQNIYPVLDFKGYKNHGTNYSLRKENSGRYKHFPRHSVPSP